MSSPHTTPFLCVALFYYSFVVLPGGGCGGGVLRNWEGGGVGLFLKCLNGSVPSAYLSAFSLPVWGNVPGMVLELPAAMRVALLGDSQLPQ